MNDCGGTEDLFVSSNATMGAIFKVSRGEGQPPYEYMMAHRWNSNHSWILSHLTESINGTPQRLFEFGVEATYSGFNPHPTLGKEYLIVTEFR